MEKAFFTGLKEKCAVGNLASDHLLAPFPVIVTLPPDLQALLSINAKRQPNTAQIADLTAKTRISPGWRKVGESR
jgi:hypothetical protein